MKLDIHVTFTNPLLRKYPYIEAIRSYLSVGDRVVVVDGGSTDGSVANIQKEFPQVKIITIPWEWEYAQREFPIHLNAGLNACDGDWIMKCDGDFVFHENDVKRIRQKIEDADQSKKLLALSRFNVVNMHKGFIKARIPWVVNGRMKSQLQYGVDASDPNCDWSWIVQVEKYVDGIPYGSYVEKKDIHYLGERVWNYGYFFRTKQEAREMYARAARAYWKQTGKAIWGATEEQSWHIFAIQERRRSELPMESMTLEQHPKVMHEKLHAVTPEQYGFNNWDNNYDYE